MWGELPTDSKWKRDSFQTRRLFPDEGWSGASPIYLGRFLVFNLSTGDSCNRFITPCRASAVSNYKAVDRARTRYL
jgi:hypothetical protein